MQSPAYSHLQRLHSQGRLSVERLRSDSDRTAKYYRNYPSKGETPLIPHPKLFEALSLSPSNLPTEAECAVHLELLEAFHALWVKVSHCQALDQTFGIVPHKKTVYRRTYSSQRRAYFKKAVFVKDDTFPRRRKAKWSYFLELATGRFLKWITAIGHSLQVETDGVDPKLPGRLPPLDILMVWHAFLLNPRDFKAFCEKHGCSEIRRIPFPWLDIHQAIKTENWYYKQPKSSKQWLDQTLNMEPDLYVYLVMARKSKGPIASLLSNYAGNLVQPAPFAKDHGSETKSTPTDHIVIEMTQRDSTLKKSIQPLKENVERQMLFVEKMHNHLWIRSPAAQGTLRRALERYTKFLELFKAYPTAFLVPTLDIDIVWHTHQCSAMKYEMSMNNRTGQFIDHNDKIGKPTLDGGMGKTVDLFTVQFGEDYVRCLCWDCEASVSALEDADDDVGDHDIDVVIQKMQEDLEYYRAVELARRYGGPLPTR